MINTLNESQLHKTFKQLYALRYPESRMEAAFGPYIADILDPGGTIIEIQTGSLGHLRDKIRYFLEQEQTVIVVFPLATTKYIVTHDISSRTERKRKSPLHKTVYSAFRELTALHSLLLHPRFYLDIVDATITEVRQTCPDAVQSQNGRRRYKKNWLKIDKQLEEINTTWTFHGIQAYRKLLPQELSDTFTLKELHGTLSAEHPRVTIPELRIFLWIYIKLGIIAPSGTRSRAKTYKIL